MGAGPGQKTEVDKLPGGRVVVRAARQEGEISDFKETGQAQRNSSLSTKKRLPNWNHRGNPPVVIVPVLSDPDQGSLAPTGGTFGRSRPGSGLRLTAVAPGRGRGPPNRL